VEGREALLAGAVAERLCEGDVGWDVVRAEVACVAGGLRDPGHGLLRGPCRWIVPSLRWSWRIAKQALQVPLVLLASCDSGQVWEWGMYGKESSKSYGEKSKQEPSTENGTHDNKTLWTSRTHKSSE
jgi:hypothetical protein